MLTSISCEIPKNFCSCLGWIFYVHYLSVTLVLALLVLQEPAPNELETMGAGRMIFRGCTR